MVCLARCSLRRDSHFRLRLEYCRAKLIWTSNARPTETPLPSFGRVLLFPKQQPRLANLNTVTAFIPGMSTLRYSFHWPSAISLLMRPHVNRTFEESCQNLVCISFVY